jgi:hypothetical protein
MRIRLGFSLDFHCLNTACLPYGLGPSTQMLFLLIGIATVVFHPSVQAQSTTQGALPHPEHIVIVLEENKSAQEILPSPYAPYLNALVGQGASFTQFYALHHPSQPNYLELFSGASQGVYDDTCPPALFTTPSLGGTLLHQGLSFRGYAENLPRTLRTCTQGKTYARKHCPWLDFTDVPVSASANFQQFPHEAIGFAQLPTVSLVIPNLVNDMHSTKTKTLTPLPQEVANGDAWLRTNLNAYVQWAKTHNSLLIVTWDEDSAAYPYPTNPAQMITTHPPQNHIATIMVGAMVIPGATSSQPYTHDDLLRTIEDMYGLPLLGGSQNAKDITEIWQ